MSFSKVLMVVLYLVVSFTAFSQNKLSIEQIFENKTVKEGKINDLYFLCKKSPQDYFLADNSTNLSSFKDAQFLDTSNKLFDVKARYDSKFDAIEIVFNNGIYVLYPHLVQAIQIENILFSSHLINKNEIETYAYLQINLLGKVNLYTSVNKNANTKKASVFVKKMEGRTSKIKLKKKTVLELLADKRTQIERFVIEQNLNYCKFEDLKTILTYYNSL